MPVGHFLTSRATLYEGGESMVDAVDAEDAKLVEPVRQEVSELLANLDQTDDLLTAWTFTTMTVQAPLDELAQLPETLGVSPEPTDVEHMTPVQAAGDFPLGIASLVSVGDVYNGYIESPVFLDPLTRGWRTDGGHEVQKIPFTLTVPRSVEAGKPLPVVIFGHAIMTERRFVLAIAEHLAARGFAAISIDFPFHGDRTYCWSEGPLSIPDPQTGELTPLDDPCQDGYTCADDGRCVDTSGHGNELRDWPIIGMHQASGAAFIEIEKISNTRDHFRQSVIDLRALLRSLQKGDWESVMGAPVDTDRIYYAGQSLGGIIGATFVPLSPEIKRAVLNVPGADTVDLFSESDYFGMHVDAFFNREQVDKASFEGHRFLNVARWFMDSTDPHSVADRMMDGREVLIQMATLDFIIPNAYTRKLEELTGAPRRDYVAEHAFLVIPIEPEYLRGATEMARFLSGDLQP
jgi:dienelactone hydrolase